MGKLSREKGKRFERYVANLFKDWGYDAHRTAQYRGNTGQAGDVEGIPGIHIECKHYKEIGRVYDWYEQSESDARAAGKCVQCGADPKPGRTLCPVCMAKQVKYSMRYKAKCNTMET